MSEKTNFTLKDGELFGPLEAGRLLGVGPIQSNILSG